MIYFPKLHQQRPKGKYRKYELSGVLYQLQLSMNVK